MSAAAGGADEAAAERRLLGDAGLLSPARARSFVVRPFEVPAGAGTLRIRFSFGPPRPAQYRNLVTLSLFDPDGFRGAGHRHAPRQEVLVGPQGATPGFVPGPLTPGRWTLEVDCHAVLPSEIGGVEYALEVDALPGPPPDVMTGTFAAARAEGTEPASVVPEFDPRPAPAGSEADRSASDAAPRWLKGDLHLHSNHSDGRWTVEDIARYVERNRLDFVAFTEHNTTTAYADAVEAFRRLGIGAVVVPGMELTTFYGHANALGTAEWIDWRVRGPEGLPRTIGDRAEGCWAADTSTMTQAAAAVHALGATFVVNHPYSPGYPACTGCRWEMGDTTLEYADAIEVWNGPWHSRGQNARALRTWNRWLSSGRRLPATAGTDSHTAPGQPAELGYTHVWASPTAAGILDAVRAGRSYLSRGPSLVWTSPTPAATVDGAAHELTLEIGDLHEPAELRLMAGGETLSMRELRGPAAVSFPLGEADSRYTWYRADLYRRGSDAVLALTNPVYRAK